MASTPPVPTGSTGPATTKSTTTAAEYNPNVSLEAEEDSGEVSDFTTGSLSTLTQSVTSSVRDYVYENGRRYHRYGAKDSYMLPNDEAEQDRLDIGHHVFNLILKGELHLAPIKEVHRVLDCGTGTGIWALDFGEIHPEAEVVGVDLSPIQPSWVYSNVKFEVDDLEKDWTWPANYFDFIHARMIEDGIKDHAKFVRQMFNHVRPGGFVEISEVEHGQLRCDDNTYAGSTLNKYFDLFVSSCQNAGMQFVTGDYTKKVMEEAGFVDVVVHTFAWPWGAWPKDKRLKTVGNATAAMLQTGFEAYGLGVMTRFGGVTLEEAQDLCKGALAEVVSRKVHAYNIIWQIVGRKPE